MWHPVSKMGMGAAAATLGQTVTFPVDTVRRRMQMSGAPGTHTRYPTFWCVMGHEGFIPQQKPLMGSLSLPSPVFFSLCPVRQRQQRIEPRNNPQETAVMDRAPV